MDPLDEFFSAHRNGKGKPGKPETRSAQALREPMDLSETLFFWSPKIRFSLEDVFKAGIICGEMGAGQFGHASNQSPDDKRSTRRAKKAE
jgi:hypothetical protein